MGSRHLISAAIKPRRPHRPHPRRSTGRRCRNRPRSELRPCSPPGPRPRAAGVGRAGQDPAPGHYPLLLCRATRTSASSSDSGRARPLGVLRPAGITGTPPGEPSAAALPRDRRAEPELLRGLAKEVAGRAQGCPSVADADARIAVEGRSKGRHPKPPVSRSLTRTDHLRRGPGGRSPCPRRQRAATLADIPARNASSCGNSRRRSVPIAAGHAPLPPSTIGIPRSWPAKATGASHRARCSASVA